MTRVNRSALSALNYMSDKPENKRIPYNNSLTGSSKHLRRNMTREEKHLWYDFLKNLPFTVKRQRIIGSFIVDFYIPGKKLAIEIDGRGHNIPDKKESDKKRDELLKSAGIRVLRFSNSAVANNFVCVTQTILHELENMSDADNSIT